jgi:hypothetical protein
MSLLAIIIMLVLGVLNLYLAYEFGRFYQMGLAKDSRRFSSVKFKEILKVTNDAIILLRVRRCLQLNRIAILCFWIEIVVVIILIVQAARTT